MDVISLARELGKAIQEDERYLAFRLAAQQNDGDAELQSMIGELNLIRAQYNAENGKKDKDEEKLEALSESFSNLYNKIMATPSMAAFTAAKREMDGMMGEINGILRLCAEGEDPDTCEVAQDCGGTCGGDCGGCGE